MPPAKRAAGFTLIELMIVVSIIAIIAAIAVPNLMHSRSVADRGAVVGTLRAIVNAQNQFKAMNVLDVNGDGGSEYGTLREMCGGVPLRDGSGTVLSPKLLSASLDLVDAQGRCTKNGYYFAIYLPAANGIGLAETAANLGSIDGVLAGSYWTLLVWPIRRDSSGDVTYFVSQQGDILRSTDAPYSGTTSVPPAGAALLGTGDPNRIDTTRTAAGVAGADGYVWTVLQ